MSTWRHYPPLARVLALTMVVLLITPFVVAVIAGNLWLTHVGPDVAIPLVIALLVGIPLGLLRGRLQDKIFNNLDERRQRLKARSRKDQ